MFPIYQKVFEFINICTLSDFMLFIQYVSYFAKDYMNTNIRFVGIICIDDV